jgi:RNA polymerase sigma factor (sigma-70 family)
MTHLPHASERRQAASIIRIDDGGPARRYCCIIATSWAGEVRTRRRAAPFLACGEMDDRQAGAATDADLARRIETGAAAAMDEVLARHYAELVDYVERFTLDPDEAEDVAQEAFLALWERRVAWKRTGSLRAFLYGVARNIARNRGRHWQLRALPLDAGVTTGAASRAPGPDEVAAASELAGHLQNAVCALSARRQEIFSLARFHGLSHDEIAAVLGISRQTVANEMSASLADLRQRLYPLLR